MNRLPERSPAAAAEGSPYARHIPALDGLRALAVLGVMSSHLFAGNPSGPVSRAIAAVFSAGATGVDLFFVLSGFLISGILVDSLHDPHFFRKFYARRVLRIFPLYYGVLAVFLVLSLVHHIPDRRELLSLALYLQNTTWISAPSWAFAPPGALPLNHFWSLAVEEQFYLVWPLLVWFVGRRRSLLGLCVLAMVACPALRMFRDLAGAGFQAIHTSTLCRADTLLAGGALALALRGRFHDRVLRAVPWLFVAALPMVLLLSNAVPLHTAAANAFAGALWPTWLLAIYTALLGITLRPGWWATLCSQPVLRWIGKYSYGLYIFHLILGQWIAEPLKVFLEHVVPSKAAVVALDGLLVGAFSALIAYLSYQLFESRFLRLKRYFDYRRHPDTVTM